MKTLNITGKPGNDNPTRKGDKKALPLIISFFTGLAITACLAFIPVSNDTLLPQPAEFNPAPNTPDIFEGATSLV